ncbi:MAG: carbon-nitrogen hydrolase family protein [Desulfovibrionaceae bacterium]
MKRLRLAAVFVAAIILLGAAAPQARCAQEALEFTVVRKSFSHNASGLTLGLANLHAEVPGIAANKAKVLGALAAFKKMGVNMAVFPEFVLSGYFWEDQVACWPYMRKAALENQMDWLRREVAPLLDHTLRYVVLNVLRKGEEGKFYNSNIVLAKDRPWTELDAGYQKVFLPGIEKTYTVSGRDSQAVFDTEWGRFGLATCYDACFFPLFQEYALDRHVDAVLVLASWRGPAERDYPGVGVRTDSYYADLWELTLPALAAMNQVWILAANAVGEHAVSGAVFAGRSAVYAPSGLRLAQASGQGEELLVIENLLIRQETARERADFNYTDDFFRVYRKTTDGCFVRPRTSP